MPDTSDVLIITLIWTADVPMIAGPISIATLRRPSSAKLITGENRNPIFSNDGICIAN